MKFSIGDKVVIERYNHWIGEYDVQATIIGYGSVYMNGIMTYKLRGDNQDLFDCIPENEIKIAK